MIKTRAKTSVALVLQEKKNEVNNVTVFLSTSNSFAKHQIDGEI